MQTISFDEIDAVKNVFAVYRIRGAELHPRAVTAEAGIHPSAAYQKGEQFIGKKFDPVTRETVEEIRSRPFSVWDVSSEPQQHLKRVQEHCAYLLNILEPKAEQLRRYLEQDEKFTISFCLRWEPYGEHGSYQLPGDVLARMGRLCHFVEFSFIAILQAE